MHCVLSLLFNHVLSDTSLDRSVSSLCLVTTFFRLGPFLHLHSQQGRISVCLSSGVTSFSTPFCLLLLPLRTLVTTLDSPESSTYFKFS